MDFCIFRDTLTFSEKHPLTRLELARGQENGRPLETLLFFHVNNHLYRFFSLSQHISDCANVDFFTGHDLIKISILIGAMHIATGGSKSYRRNIKGNCKDIGVADGEVV